LLFFFPSFPKNLYLKGDLDSPLRFLAPIPYAISHASLFSIIPSYYL
jgi:hypothetical protein